MSAIKDELHVSSIENEAFSYTNLANRIASMFNDPLLEISGDE